MRLKLEIDYPDKTRDGEEDEGSLVSFTLEQEIRTDIPRQIKLQEVINFFSRAKAFFNI